LQTTPAAVARQVVEDEQEDAAEDEAVVLEEDLSDKEADSAGSGKRGESLVPRSGFNTLCVTILSKDLKLAISATSCRASVVAGERSSARPDSRN
jgi:hypothetical protein